MKKEASIDVTRIKFDGAEQEVISAQLGDKRLTKRLTCIMKAFSKHPTASIPEAMGNWNLSKATYRFFDNPKVKSTNILKAHQEVVEKRIQKKASVLLAIQDTSYIDYSSHPATKHLGFLSDEHHQGLIIHPTLLSTTEGVPLGLIDLQLLKREMIGTRDTWQTRPIEHKESYKWIRSYRATWEVNQRHPTTHIINVADREADVYELFVEALVHKKNSRHSPDVVIRAARDRTLYTEHEYLWDYMKSQDIVAETVVHLTHNEERCARKARMSVRYACITLRPPKRCAESKPLEPISLWAVYLHEEHPPRKVSPLSWMLLTTISIHDAEEALEIVQYYTRRWLIEMYFKVLKSGCAIEERQLQAEHRLINCLAVDSIIAWRILFLTMIGRALPHLSASIIFQRTECYALYSFIHSTHTLPKKEFTLQEIIFEIAKLGGFLNRSQDGPPGMICIWRGMWRLMDITATWKIFNPHIIDDDAETYG